MIQLEEQLLNFNNKNNEMQICYRGVHKIICHHSSLAKKYWGDPIHSTPEMSNDVSYHEQPNSLKKDLQRLEKLGSSYSKSTEIQFSQLILVLDS